MIPSIEDALAAWGEAAAVTLPDGTGCTTRVFWLAPTTVSVPNGEAFQRVESRRVVVVPTADVPALPRGTRIELVGGVAWRVEEVSRLDDDAHRAVVVGA